MPFSPTIDDMTLSQVEQQVSAGEREALLPMDETAFRAFYERTSRMLWLYLRRMTGDQTLADDLLQESYYRFYRAGAAHEDETHRRNYLFKIATNLARDSKRFERRHQHTSIDGEIDHEFLTADERTASRAEGRTDLQRAMAQLSPTQRQMLWLAYGMGSSHAEIAETVGVKTASVKLLLFRARKKLADLLQSDPKGGGRVTH